MLKYLPQTAVNSIIRSNMHKENIMLFGVGVWEPLQMFPVGYSGIHENIMEHLQSAIGTENLSLNLLASADMLFIQRS